MGSISFFMIIAAILLAVMFFPDLFPICSCCNKMKLRPFFRIHKTVKIRLGYSAYESICKKCCIKYDINSIRDYEMVKDIKRKVKINVETQGDGSRESWYKSSAKKKL